MQKTPELHSSVHMRETACSIFQASTKANFRATEPGIQQQSRQPAWQLESEQPPVAEHPPVVVQDIRHTAKLHYVHFQSLSK
jgi:hypothetical protein